MAISDSNRQFIDSLIDYYISEAGSYRQIAEQYVPEIESVPDAAFGIIAGCVYSSFLEMCRNQDVQPGLEEMTEFNRMLKERAAVVKKAVIDPSSIATESQQETAENMQEKAGAGKRDEHGHPTETVAGITKDGGSDHRAAPLPSQATV